MIWVTKHKDYYTETFQVRWRSSRQVVFELVTLEAFKHVKEAYPTFGLTFGLAG